MKIDVVIAHPDDEILFAGGFLQKFDDVRVICLTYGPDSPRGKEFKSVCDYFGWDGHMMGEEDAYDGRLRVTWLQTAIRRLLREGATVLTHNPLGEYGHWHHQDAYRVVAGIVPQFLVFGYNFESTLQIRLTQEEIARKVHAAENLYASQREIFGEVNGAWRMLFDTEGFAIVKHEDKQVLDLIIKSHAKPPEVDPEFEDMWGYRSSKYEGSRLAHMAAMLPDLDRDSNVIEVGAAEGSFTETLIAHFDKPTVVEQDVKMHRTLQEKVGDRAIAIQGDGFVSTTQAYWDLAVFSIVWMYATEEHWAIAGRISAKYVLICEGKAIVERLAKALSGTYTVRKWEKHAGATEPVTVVRKATGEFISLPCMVRKEPVEIVLLERI